MKPDLVETLLRNGRPEARPEFRDDLERRLFGRQAPGRRPWALPRPALAATAAAGALAAAVLGLSLAGTGPLAGSEPGPEATGNCRTVTVTKRERVPYVARSAGGEPRIAYRYEPRRRQVKRCP